MPPWLIGALIGAVVSTIWLLSMQREAKQLAPRILPLLRDKGSQSPTELAEALGLKGGNAPVKVRMALDSLVKAGEVVALVVPPGTSARERLKIGKYVIKGGSQPPQT
ncbi:MAG TPA: hypothetical protein VMJ10_31385 [Kofleriaceae bacterium]|nr:hypothetical protein [Kofleriaceae bacterium]